MSVLDCVWCVSDHEDECMMCACVVCSTHGIATMLAHPRFGSTDVLIPVMQELLDHARIVFTSLPRTVNLHTPHGPVRISFARDAAHALEEGGHLHPRDDPAGNGANTREAVPEPSAAEESTAAPHDQRQIFVNHNGAAKVVAATCNSSSVGSCTICRSEIALGQDAATTLCMHAFHTTCLERWLQREQQVALEETLSRCRCPQCNTDLLAIVPQSV